MIAITRMPGQLSDLVPICARLPSRNVDQLVGASKILMSAGGRLSHREFASALSYSHEHLAGVTELLAALGIIEVSDKALALTDVGKRVARAGIETRRRLFAELVLRLPIFQGLIDALANQPDRTLSRSRLLDSLGASSCSVDAAAAFEHLVAWGRYSGLFSYDGASDVVSLS